MSNERWLPALSLSPEVEKRLCALTSTPAGGHLSKPDGLFILGGPEHSNSIRSLADPAGCKDNGTRKPLIPLEINGTFSNSRVEIARGLPCIFLTTVQTTWSLCRDRPQFRYVHAAHLNSQDLHARFLSTDESIHPTLSPRRFALPNQSRRASERDI